MKDKILEYQNLHVLRSSLHNSQVLVLVTGVFDLLHKGHTQFLKKAKQKGDVLLVGLESDKRVRELKGVGRPVETLHKRLTKVSQLEYVDFAFALPSQFDSIERERFIATVRPDVLAISSHSLHQDVKRVLVEKYGGRLEVVMERDVRYSTTKKITKKAVSAKEC